MKLTGLSRKRPHEEGGPEEFIPIAKKLNSLDLNSSLHIAVRSSNSNQSSHPSEEPGKLHAHHPPPQNHLEPFNSNYEPSLNYSQNPIYYEQNRLLYDAHVSRMTRNVVTNVHLSPPPIDK